MSNKAILNYLFRNSVRAAGDPEREEMDEDAEERRMSDYDDDRFEDERIRERCHEF